MKEAVAGVVAELTRFLLAMVLLSINGGVLYWVLVHGVTDASKELGYAIVNGTGTITGLVISYYFGSSAGSAAKDRVIADNATTAAKKTP